MFKDEITDMEKQARQIATWGKNVYVKIPITTQKVRVLELVNKLSNEGFLAMLRRSLQLNS